MTDLLAAREEMPPGYKRTEAGVIPEDWSACRIGDFCITYTGGTPLTSQPDYYGGDIPWITSGDLNVRRITDVAGRITQNGFDSSAAKIAKCGSLLMALYGATAGVVAVTEIDAAINQAILVISTESCNKEYLFQHLASRKNWIVETYTQGGQPNLSGEIIRSLIVALPPLSEQRAIAAALSDVDGLIGALDALIEKKRAIKQAAMQQLLTGKKRLPGFSGEEPLGNERKNVTRAVAGDMAPCYSYYRTDFGLIPIDWDTRTLGEIGQCLIGLTYNPKDVSTDGLLVLRSSNIGDGSLQFEDSVFVEMDVPDKLIVFNGDLLICVRNGSRPLIGKCALIDKYAAGMTFGAFMSVYRSPYNRFVFYCFQSGIVKRQIHAHLGATINQITNKSLKSFQIPFPAPEEQRAISAVLSDMDAEITALERRREKAAQIKQGMMQQLLTGCIRLVEPPEVAAA